MDTTYMNKTFCEEYVLCQTGATCDRALTPKVLNMAKIWTLNKGLDGLLLKKFIGKPRCFNEWKG